MPIHGLTGTRARLFTWDPRQGQDDPILRTPSGNRDIQPLAEEWFEGQEGLQYFDSKAVLPYYLVNAGRSLIFRTTAPPEPSLAALQDLKEIVEKLKGEKAAIPASLGDLQSTSKSNVPETQNPHIDADTTLSSKEEDANENWSVIEKDPTSRYKPNRCIC
jgi:hypothetical protein